MNSFFSKAISRCLLPGKKYEVQDTMDTSTYASQANLSRLPIPSLEETATRFLEAVQALLTPAQYEHTKDIVAKFLSDPSDGGAPSLQSILRAYDEQGARDASIGSYIEEFWNDAYLAPDCSVVLNLNPFFLLEDDPDAKIGRNQISRAASLTYNSLKFAASLKNESLTPDNFKGRAICMDQFRSLFGSCRIPKVGEKDIVEVDVESDHVAVLYRNQFYYFRALWPRDCNSHDDSVNITNANTSIGNDNKNGSEKEKEDIEVEKRLGEVKVAVSQADIKQILQSIVEDGDSIPLAESSKTALGVLTTLPRKAWAKAREQLVKTSAENQSALEVIDSALFVLVLDDYAPQSIHDAAANMLHGTHIMKEVEDETTFAFGSTATGSNGNGSIHRSGITSTNNSEHGSSMKRAMVKQEYQCGTCCNRWYDKIQIIVCKDGSAGINFEHSAIDGHTALRFASDVYAQTVVAFAKSITKSVYTRGCPIPNIISAEVVRADNYRNTIGAGNGNDKMIMDTNPKKLSFDIVEKLQDRIFHAETSLGDALNADDTYVLEFTEFGKNFFVGNKLSPDSVVQMSIMIAYHRLYGGEQMVSTYEPVLTKGFYHGRTEAMRSATMKAAALCRCWMNRLASKKDKLKSLREATKYHSSKVREALGGKGCDRHLYALKCIAEKKGLPTHEFFQSDAWNALNHTVLSTSNCGNPALRLFGFGPVTYDGFGIGYIIKDNAIQYSISSKHRQTRRYAHAIRETLYEIGELLEPLNAQALGHHRDTLMSQTNEAKAGPSIQTITKGMDEVEFADGWADIYGDTTNVKIPSGELPIPPSTSVPTITSPSMERVPSQSSFVGITRKVSKSKRMKSIGRQISDRDLQ